MCSVTPNFPDVPVHEEEGDHENYPASSAPPPAETVAATFAVPLSDAVKPSVRVLSMSSRYVFYLCLPYVFFQSPRLVNF